MYPFLIPLLRRKADPRLADARLSAKEFAQALLAGAVALAGIGFAFWLAARSVLA